jgi:hypothetical protein
VGVDEAERRLLVHEVNKDAREDRVFEDVGETAGMKGVAVVHDRETRSNPGPKRRRARQRTGATAIEPRWQLWRATLRQIA